MYKQKMLNIIPETDIKNENELLNKKIIKNKQYLIDIENADIFTVEKIIQDFQEGKILQSQKKKIDDIKKVVINDIINNSEVYSNKVDNLSKIISDIDREQFYLLDKMKEEVDNIKYNEVLDDKFYQDLVLAKIVFNLLYHNIGCNKNNLLDLISKIEFKQDHTYSTVEVNSKKITIEFGSMAYLFKEKNAKIVSKIKHGTSIYSILLSCYATSYISKDIFITKTEDIGKKINNLSNTNKEEIKNKKVEMMEYIEKIDESQKRKNRNQHLLDKELCNQNNNNNLLSIFKLSYANKYSLELRNKIDEFEKKININRFNIQKYKDETVSSDNHINNSILEYESGIRYIISRHYLAYKGIVDEEI